MTPHQVTILNRTLRKKTKSIDSHYIYKVINQDHETILRWKKGLYDFNAKELNLLIENFS